MGSLRRYSLISLNTRKDKSIMSEVGICTRCNEHSAQLPHQCPYAMEISDNDDPYFCTCCEQCEQECADDI